jgi:hypothetical protein
VSPQEYKNDEYTQRQKQKKGIRENIRFVIYKSPLKKGADDEIDKIPKAYEQVRPLPYLRYVDYPLH